jgi:hypothetical protein
MFFADVGVRVDIEDTSSKLQLELKILRQISLFNLS